MHITHLDGHVFTAQRHHDLNGWEVVLVLMGLNCSSHRILQKEKLKSQSLKSRHSDLIVLR